MTRSKLAIALLVSSIAAAGCASAPQPTPDLARAHTLVDQAEQSGAPQFASADLASARSKLQSADQAARGQPQQSIQLAQEAAVDARVAMARTNAAKAQLALRDVNAGTQTLRNETDRAQSVQSDGAMMPSPQSPQPQ
jgi:hypothetical protein